MSIAELLLETAESDHQLLQTNLDLGDDPEQPRDLEFILYSNTEDLAALVCDFITGNGYGRPSFLRMDSDDGVPFWRILVAVHAPATQEIVCTLSGFMACLSKIYDLEYDGWGCVICKDG